jgi:hypothetical protein
MKRIPCVVLVFVLPSLLSAQVLLSNYDAARKAQDFKGYIHGVGVGFFWANSELTVNKHAPLYCQPEKLALNGDNYVEMLDAAVKDYRALVAEGKTQLPPDPYIELLLLKQLERVFPCQSPKP